MNKKRIPLPNGHDRKTIKNWLRDNINLTTNELVKLSGIPKRTILKWRIICDVFRPDEHDILKAWMKYKGYNMSQASSILGLSIGILSNHLSGKRYDAYVKENIDKLYKLEEMDKSVLQDRDELLKAYSKYGKKRLAQIFNVSTTRMLHILRKFDISPDDVDQNKRKPSRPALSKKVNLKRKPREDLEVSFDWVYEHYIEKGLSIRECSKLLNIGIYSFYSHLREYGIRRKGNKVILTDEANSLLQTRRTRKN